MAGTYDAIIIGGGHNGLVCAAYLAQRGRKVLVLERRHLLGGACVTEEQEVTLDSPTGKKTGRVKKSRAAYVFSLFHPKIVKDLELLAYGLKLHKRIPSSVTILKDGRSLTLGHARIEDDQAEIAKFSESDAKRYPEYLATLDRIARFMEKFLLMTPPDPLNPWDWPKLLAFGKKTLGLGKDLYTLVRLFTLSAHEFVSNWFESEPLIATLCTDGIIGTCGGPYTPGTAYVLLHHVMGEVDGEVGRWAYVEGGMGALCDAIAASADEDNVEFRVNAEVAEILVKKGRAIGVRLTDGTVIHAKTIVSGTDPNQTFKVMLSEEARKAHLPADFLRDIDGIDYSSMTSKVNLVLSGPLTFHHYDRPVVGTFHVLGNDSSYIERAFDCAKYGRISDDLVLEGCIPSVTDATLVPPGSGMHVLSLLVQYTPYHLAQGEWDDNMKRLLLRRVVNKLHEYTNIAEVMIGEADVLSPLDLEKEFRLTGGNLFHGSMGINQLFLMRPLPGWAKYRTPIKGLYLCGSGTHPGGGVTGIPGHNAAREILKDSWF